MNLTLSSKLIMQCLSLTLFGELISLIHCTIQTGLTNYVSYQEFYVYGVTV